MRLGAGIGLLGLLVVVAIAMVWFSETQIPVAKRGAEAQNEARQIAGYGQDGRPATASITVQGKTRGNTMTALLVADIEPGGTMQKVYGLQKDDEIIQMGEQTMDMMLNDEKLAEARLLEAFQGSRPLIVRRGGQTLTLTPNGGPAANPAGAPGSAGVPGGTAPGLNSIKIPTH